MVYDDSALGIRDGGVGEVPASWRLVEQVLIDSDVSQTRSPAPVTEFCLMASGRPLIRYRPVHEARREQFVSWAFTLAIDRNSSAVAEVTAAATQDKTQGHHDGLGFPEVVPRSS